MFKQDENMLRYGAMPVDHLFLQDYLGTDDENRINEVAEKASLIGYSRLIRKLRKKMTLSDGDRALISHCVEKIAELTDKLDSLEI